MIFITLDEIKHEHRNSLLLRYLLVSLVILLFLLWNFMVNNFSQLLILSSKLFKGNVGFGIIALTVLVRWCLTPLIYMSKNKTQREQKLAPLYSNFEKKYNTYDTPTLMKLFTKRHQLKNKIGLHHPLILFCLPFLIEVYILDMFYLAVRYTPLLNHNMFFGVALNRISSNIWLPIIAAGLTLSEQILVKLINHAHNRLSWILLIGYPLWVLWMGHTVRAVLIVYWIGIYSAILLQNIGYYLYNHYHSKHYTYFK